MMYFGIMKLELYKCLSLYMPLSFSPHLYTFIVRVGTNRLAPIYILLPLGLCCNGLTFKTR